MSAYKVPYLPTNKVRDTRGGGNDNDEAAATGDAEADAVGWVLVAALRDPLSPLSLFALHSRAPLDTAITRMQLAQMHALLSSGRELCACSAMRTTGGALPAAVACCRQTLATH